MADRVRIDWVCPKCEHENRASWSEADGEIVCQKCKAVSVWRDVLSGAEIFNLIGSIPSQKVVPVLDEYHCPICGGELVWMGSLGGKKVWFRCRNCGIDVAQETNEQDSISE